MNKAIKWLLVLLTIAPALAGTAMAQKYYTKNGTISFFSKTSIENISADNNQVVSVLNTQNGELQFSLIIKNFHFKKALMEEHFNENYLESDKFPKATFKGNITDLAKVNFTTDGSYNVNIGGDLSMHGVSKKISAVGTITVKAGKIAGSSRFLVKPSEYDIRIPKLVKDNIAETIEITVSCNYDQKM
ncbi:MAG: YceI family protein [Ferruginibacter sp.]|nr:YceI family protein [Ferruginibacter sp.]